MKKNRFLFTVVLTLPALLLFGLLAATAVDLYRVRNVKPSEMLETLKARLEQKDAASFPLPDRLFMQHESRPTVFVFGSSDLLLSDGGVFPDYLEQFHGELNVINLGIMGIDSFAVKKRVMEALAVARPDVIVLFFGHNDYNTAYHGTLLPEYFDRFDTLLRLPHVFHSGDKKEGVLLTDEFYWFARYTRPSLYQVFQRLHLVAFDHKDFEPIDALVLDHFRRNYDSILNVAASIQVPVVAILPVGNLHAEPFGDYRATTAWYRQGLSEPDYDRSLALLKKARDTEILTYDLRAKSPLLLYLKSLKRPGVHVMDLEAVLETRKFEFGYSDFLDYVHLNDRTHRLLAEITYDFMLRNDLLRRHSQKSQ